MQASSNGEGAGWGEEMATEAPTGVRAALLAAATEAEAQASVSMENFELIRVLGKGGQLNRPLSHPVSERARLQRTGRSSWFAKWAAPTRASSTP